jgi:hypothetical protein
MKNLNMRCSDSELNPRAPVQWIKNPSRNISSQIVFYRCLKFEDSRLKNEDKLGTDSQTDGQTGGWTDKVNEFNIGYFLRNML